MVCTETMRWGKTRRVWRTLAGFAIAGWLIAGCNDAEPREQDVTYMTTCGATGDYVEANEMGNDVHSGGAAEPTGLVAAPGGGFSIGGCVAAGGVADVGSDNDAYAFEVTQTVRLRAELRWMAAAGRTHTVAILRADQTPAAWWSAANAGAASTRAVTLDPGQYMLHVFAGEPTPAEAYSYELTLVEDTSTCSSAGLTAAYVEADESGAGSRANDVAAVSWPDTVAVTATSASDAPEHTGLVVGSPSAQLIQGLSDDVGSDGDSYLDRDTYQVQVGPGANRLVVQAAHAAADVNLDVVVLDAGTTSTVRGTGADVSFGGDEAVALTDPGATYWIWVGAGDDRSIEASAGVPLEYDLTICGF